MSSTQASGLRLGWIGDIYLDGGWAAFEGRSGDNAIHAHHALQIAVTQSAPMDIWIEGDGIISASAMLINADVPHRLSDGKVRLLYVDRESIVGRNLSVATVDRFRLLSNVEQARFNDIWTQGFQRPNAFDPLWKTFGISIAPNPATSRQAKRVQHLIDGLKLRLGDPLDLPRLANETSLSPSRFQHLFKDIVGMPVRPYVRWIRLQAALKAICDGETITDAAINAGFADAPHFSRTMQRHFGISPRAILKALR
ncbi:MAG: helix-turn-helix transcriptional regulator [Arenimonas sp.]